MRTMRIPLGVALGVVVGCTRENPNYVGEPPWWWAEIHPDLAAAPADLARPPDLGAVDRAPPPDLAPTPDLAVVRDLAPAPDLLVAADLAPPPPDLTSRCGKVGDPCCGGGAYCEGERVMCDPLEDTGLCVACGAAHPGACASDAADSCGEPCCGGTDCYLGTCMISSGAARRCIACDRPDPDCAECGSTGQRCCFDVWCRKPLGCRGPFADGSKRCI